jgi:hypothetical protein
MSPRRIHFFLDFFEVPDHWEREFSQYLYQSPRTLDEFDRIRDHAGRYIPLHDIRPRLVTHYQYDSHPPFQPQHIDNTITWVFYIDDMSKITSNTSEFHWDRRRMKADYLDRRSRHEFRINYYYKPRVKFEEMAALYQFNPDWTKLMNMPACIRGEEPLKNPLKTP